MKRRIVVFSYMGIGDNFMFLRALSLYNLSNCSIAWIVKEECVEVIDCFLANEKTSFFSIKGKKGFKDVFSSTFKIIGFLRSFKPQKAIILDYKSKPVAFFAAIAKIGGIKKVASTISNPNLRLLIAPYYHLEKYLEKHEVERYVDLLDICFERKELGSLGFLNKLSFNHEIVCSTEYVVIVPGSARKFKQWDIENYIYVVNFLLGKGYDVIILGGKGDIDLGNKICEKLNTQRVKNLVDRTSLRKSAFVLANSALTVSNDSAMMHLADLMGTKVIGLFGITRPERCGPYTQLKNSIVSKYKSAGTYSFGDFGDWNSDCINQIGVLEVCNKIERLLEKNVSLRRVGR